MASIGLAVEQVRNQGLVGNQVEVVDNLVAVVGKPLEEDKHPLVVVGKHHPVVGVGMRHPVEGVDSNLVAGVAGSNLQGALQVVGLLVVVVVVVQPFLNSI